MPHPGRITHWESGFGRTRLQRAKVRRRWAILRFASAASADRQRLPALAGYCQWRG